MFYTLFRGYLAAMAVKLLESYRHLSVQYLKIEAAKSYLHGVRLARLSTLGILCLFLFVGLICIGVILFHVGLFILLPCSLKAKALVGLLLGLVYTIAGVVALVVSMDEKRWMDKSGATAMIKEATGQHRKG